MHFIVYGSMCRRVAVLFLLRQEVQVLVVTTDARADADFVHDGGLEPFCGVNRPTVTLLSHFGRRNPERL
jgi:hypothetical protein